MHLTGILGLSGCFSSYAKAVHSLQLCETLEYFSELKVSSKNDFFVVTRTVCKFHVDFPLCEGLRLALVST